MLEARPLGRIRFQLLGQPGLFAGHSNTAVRVSTQKGFALLAYLALNAGRPVGRGVLADLLWGDRAEAQARQNLRQAILTLRRDLGAAGSASLNADDQSVSLAVEADDVDALQFAACAASADPAQRQRCLEIPWAPFLGNFSVGAEAFDEWAAAERHRLDTIATRVFSDLAKQFDAAGDGERAILATERLVAIDPVDEERLRRLLMLEARYRGPDAALARAKELVARLKREVDAEPEAATRAIIDDIKRGLASPPRLSTAAEARTGTEAAAKPTSATSRVEPPRATPAPWLTREVFLGRPGVALCAIIALIAAGLLWTSYGRSPSGGGGSKPAVASSTPDSWQSPGGSRGASSRLVPIAVLPFTTSGAEAEALQPTAEAVTDDLTNILSRVPGLRVISRQTMRAYRERAVDIATIGTELGVRYVLEGSMHKVGDRLRVNAELIDPRSRSPVWSDRIERDIGRQHEILDEIVGRLGRQLQMSVTMTEAVRAATDPSVAALLQKGWAAHYSAGTRGLGGIEQARSYFSRALEQEPDNVAAKTGMAAVLVSLVIQDSSNDHPGSLDRAETLLREAIAASPRSNGAHYYMGVVHRVRGRPMDAIASFEQAIEINPSHASSYAHLGFMLSRVGQPAKGLEYIQYAMRLSPKDPILSHWLNFAGFAELELERDERAIDLFRRALDLRRSYHAPYVGLAVAYALTGRLDDAHRMLAELRAFAPKLSRDRLLERFGDRGTTKRRLTRGLELALAPAASPSWQSPLLPSQRADDILAPGRGVVAIGVLPFTFHSESGNGHGVIADMVTDDLTYLLSRAPVFRVISRQTMMSYRGQTIDARALGSELGVHYLLEGNVSIRGDVLRVAVGLIDTRTRLHVWSGSFERTGEDRHALQTEIVTSVGRELHYSVAGVEGMRASSSPDVNELIFRGFAAIGESRRRGAEGLRPAENHFEQALQKDPGAIRASVGLGLFHTHMALQMFAPEPAPHLARAEEILRPITERHPRFSEAHAGMGLIHAARGEMREAIAAFERAITLDPSNAPSHAQIGRALVRLGHPQMGLAHINYAMKLSPRDPVIGYWIAFAGYAELELGNFERAVEHLNRSHSMNPTQPRTLQVLIAANALAGNLGLARQQLALLQQQHPHLTHERLRKMYSHQSRTGTRFQEGMLRVLSEQAAGAPQHRADNPSRSNVGTGATPVAVLPFTSHAEAGDRAHLVADILTDDLTVQLSRIPGLLVTARQSVSAYKGKPVDAARIASELKVRYLLEGSVRPQGQGLRINVALVDAANGLHLWNTRFLHEGADRNETHDEIVARLSRELQVEIYSAESKKRRDDPFSALMFKGWDHLGRAQHIGDDIESARAAFAEALSLQPKHSRALTGMAAYHVAFAQMSLSDHDRHFAAAEVMLQDVIARGRPSPMTHSLLGRIHTHHGRIEQALRQFDLALAIDPNNASVHAQVGHTLLRAGRVDEALDRIHQAMRLSPNDRAMPTWLRFAAEAELERGDVEAAIASLRKAKKAAPRNIHILGDLAAAYALAGQAEEARALVSELRRAAPHLSDEQLIEGFGGNNPHRARTSQGMRQALATPQLRGSISDVKSTARIGQYR
jgi:TolB-like protein/Tfp pilus assembly protein PilF/DNA-binding SARP family transcriptional activator